MINYLRWWLRRREEAKEEEKKSEATVIFEQESVKKSEATVTIEQESGVQYMERRRQQIISSTKNEIYLRNSARLGTDDFDFESA